MSTKTQTIKPVILGYLSYLALFIGTAFISGAIVHSGNISELSKYIIIGVIGVSMFISGSFVQEFILNKENLREEGVVKFFLYSLLLSIGIGMISGGTQHFSDFPVYSSYLIPLGLILSYFAYLLKNNFTFTKKLLLTGSMLALIAGVGFLGLNSFANNLQNQTAKDKAALCAKITFNLFVILSKASAGHEDQTNCNSNSQSKAVEGKDGCPAGQSKREMLMMCMNDSQLQSLTKDSSMNMHDMTSMVVDDKSFLEGMIPHHIEAVNTSKIIVQSTKDTELKDFANKVIVDQSKEIEMMKNWYKTLTNSDYKDNGKYQPMMTSMSSMMNTDLDKAYIQGMIAHHNGAIDMAKKILPISKLSDVKTLANNITSNQAKEVETLSNWLKTKFVSTQPSNQSNSASSKNTMMDSDGHMGH